MKGLLAILFLIFTFALSAQEAASVTGVVRDKETQPVEGATIRAFTTDSVFLSGATTNKKGVFRFQVPHTGSYLEITCLGYQKGIVP